jgi:hypothetical protein
MRDVDEHLSILIDNLKSKTVHALDAVGRRCRRGAAR